MTGGLPWEPEALVPLPGGDDLREEVQVGVPVLPVHDDVNEEVDAVLDPVQDVEGQKPLLVNHISVQNVSHQHRNAAHHQQQEDDENCPGNPHVAFARGKTLAQRGRSSGAEGPKEKIGLEKWGMRKKIKLFQR